MYQNDPVFGQIWIDLQQGHWEDYYLCEGFLFRGVELCVTVCSLREHLIMELHAGSLSGHFGCDKIVALVEQDYYWPQLHRDVTQFVERCHTY